MQALLGHDHFYVVLGVVYIRDHGHDAGDRANLGYCGRHEKRLLCVARAAGAVHDAWARNEA